MAGVFLAIRALLRPRLTHWGWEKLLNKVERVIAEMESSDFPKPTHQMCQLLVAGEDRRMQGRTPYQVFKAGLTDARKTAKARKEDASKKAA